MPALRKPPFHRKTSPFTWLLVFIFLIVLGYSLTGDLQGQNAEDVPISVVQNAYQSTTEATPEDEALKSIEITGNEILAEFENGRRIRSYKESAANIKDLNLTGNPEVEVKITNEESKKFWTEVALSLIPIVIILGLAYLFLRNIAGQNKSALSFGQSSARPINANGKKTTFSDVAGAKEAKHEMEEIVDFLRHPKKYNQIGAKIPKGVLLVGAPGTGKTLLARAVAGEANVPFFSLSGSEFVEMFVGVGASRVRDLFKKAKKNSPCIIFIDELDAVGRQRGTGLGGGHDEREQTLNQILTEMDGFEKGENVIVIAATNRPDVLDPALLRPGRFDRHVTLDKPDSEERREILKVHSEKKPLAKEVSLDRIARQTPGFVGAELENLINEGAILAARENRRTILQRDLEEAMEKVMMGPQRRSRVITPRERKIIAHHEAGHAIVGHFLPNCDPVHKISIISRGMSLGVTWFIPKEDERLRSKEKFEDELASLLGGRIAEEIFFKDITTGASNDLERATKIAHDMVTRYGMSNLGNITYGENKGSVFLGKELMHEKNYSENTAQLIDAEISNILKKADKIAHTLIKKHQKTLQSLAEALLKEETLSREEFEKIIDSFEKKTTPKPKKKPSPSKKG